MDRDAFVYIQQLYGDIKNGLSNIKLETPQPADSPQATISVKEIPVAFKNYWQLLSEDIEALGSVLQNVKTLPVLGNTELQRSPEHIKDNIIPTITELQARLFGFDWANEDSMEELDIIVALGERLGSQLFPPQPKAPKPRRKAPIRRVAPIRRAKRNKDEADAETDADAGEERIAWTLNPTEVYLEMKLKKNGDN